MNCDSEDSDEYFSDEEDVVYYNLIWTSRLETKHINSNKVYYYCI